MLEIKDKIFITFPDTDGCDTIQCKEKYKQQILQDQKLRKLIEKKIRKLAGNIYSDKHYLRELRQILKDSKK